ncbi:MAG: ribokinase [Acidimicrobiia bacterium]|nr:ribokinase [Acidimicrobiia bacterium]
MARIAVVGSTNLDLVATADRLPTPGETVVNAALERHRGGKGANQALSAARFGADVAFIGATGDDPEADFALALLADAGVDLSGVVRLPEVSTGLALIMVDAGGENQIMVASGANGRLAPEHLRLAEADAVLLQFEIPPTTVDAAVSTAAGIVVVNAAPARPLSGAVLAHTDVLIVNEGEFEAVRDDLHGFVGTVVRTLGPNGAEALVEGTVTTRVPAPSITAVDTVGAGDAFCGALTTVLAEGASLEDAMRWGCAAGAFAATRNGVQASLGTRDEVARLL